MPEYRPTLTAIAQDLGDGAFLGETLLFPEASALADSPERVWAALEADVKRLFKDLPAGWLFTRHLAEPPSVRTVTVTVEPPRRSPEWTEPVRLAFRVLVWRHASDAVVAFVPALGIEVLAERAEELDGSGDGDGGRIAQHIGFALKRMGLTNLPALARLERFGEITLRTRPAELSLPTPKHAAMEEAKGRTEQKSALAEAAEELTAPATLAALPTAHEVDGVVRLIVDALTGRRPRSVLLVGPSGVGKTAAVRELVRRRGDFGLGKTPFWATGGSRLVAGMSGFGMWQERCGRLCREASATGAVLHVGSLVELMQVGKSVHNAQGIAAYLRPHLSRGDLLVIAEATPEQIPVIEREDPHLLGVFAQVNVPEPDAAATRRILSARLAASTAAWAEGGTAAPPMGADALDTVDRLHRRYATYSAAPGRPLRFLENLLDDRGFHRTGSAEARRAAAGGEFHPAKWSADRNPDAGKPYGPSDVIAAFSRETGLPRFLLDPAEPLDLAAARRFFAERVIGQPEAVDLVTDLLSTVKAGLTRPGKPIASLMFIGPTGVGKTEMAKSLAEFLFGDKGRLTRFDMSEYSDPVAVRRLVGGVFGAEGLLTARVREQPFSVVLLDEFEKADPSLADLLLQVFGEGRLTDAGGRVADFRNAVIILTSNLGAEGYQRGRAGFVKDAAARADARAHFTEAVRDAVRPELFNRIDRIVAFAPLDEATVAAVARREIALIRRRDGLRLRGVSMEVPDDAVAHLAAAGYDIRYGARPLKRAVERQLLTPLASALAAQPDGVALSAEVRKAKGGKGLDVEVKARLPSDGTAAPDGRPPLATTAETCVKLRRLVQRLERSAVAVELANDLFTLERLEGNLLRRGFESSRRDGERLARLASLRRLTGAIASVSQRVTEMEDRLLTALYEDSPAPPDPESELAAAEADFDEVLLELHIRRYKRPDDILLGLFCEERGPMFELARAYRAVAETFFTEVRLLAFTPAKTGRELGGVVYVSSAESSWVIVGRISSRDADCLAEAPGVFVEQVKHQAELADKQCADLRKLLADPERFLSSPRDGVVGLALQLKGAAAWPKFEDEHGFHLFIDGKKQHKVLVTAFGDKPELFIPPEGIERKGGLAVQGDKVRTYEAAKGQMTDHALGKAFPWASPDDPDGPWNGLRTAVSERLSATVRKILDGDNAPSDNDRDDDD